MSPRNKLECHFVTILCSATETKSKTLPEVRPRTLSGSHNRILDFSFDGGTENATKLHSNWAPGLIFVRSVYLFEPDASGGVCGLNLSGKRPEIKPNSI